MAEFTVVAISTVVVPSVAYAVAGAPGCGSTRRAEWLLQDTDATVMAALLRALCVSLLGKGLGGLL